MRALPVPAFAPLRQAPPGKTAVKDAPAALPAPIALVKARRAAVPAMKVAKREAPAPAASPVVIPTAIRTAIRERETRGF